MEMDHINDQNKKITMFLDVVLHTSIGTYDCTITGVEVDHEQMYDIKIRRQRHEVVTGQAMEIWSAEFMMRMDAAGNWLLRSRWAKKPETLPPYWLEIEQLVAGHIATNR